MHPTATHAGGIVYRRRNSIVEYLLVRPKDGSDEWVFPKGHIEEGEDPTTAALREVREEAGILARVVDVAAQGLRYRAKGENVDVTFYLMEYLGETEPAEQRQKEWFALVQARQVLRHEESKKALALAEAKRVQRST